VRLLKREKRGRLRCAGEGIVSEQPPTERPPSGWYPDPTGLQALRWWDGARWSQQTQPLPGRGQESEPPHLPQQSYDQQPPRNPYDQSDPDQRQGEPPWQDQAYQGQPSYAPQQPQQSYGQDPQGPQPPHPGRRHDRRAQASWPSRHKVLSGVIAVAALFIAGSIGAVAGKGSASSGSAAPAPTVTVTHVQQEAAPTATVTVSVTPTTNAQGEATQISADGVYVVGQDIPGGTWHTSGGSQCYEATLASTDTSNIIDNNNFTGPDTVSLGGAKAFDITGGCTWQHEG
jgi:hypothetical protein